MTYSHLQFAQGDGAGIDHHKDLYRQSSPYTVLVRNPKKICGFCQILTFMVRNYCSRNAKKVDFGNATCLILGS